MRHNYYVFLLVLLFSFSAHAQAPILEGQSTVTPTGTWNFNSGIVLAPIDATQPATCDQGSIAIHEDQATGGRLCYCETGDDWKCGSTAGLQTAKTAEPTIDDATDLASSVQIGSAAANVFWCFYYDTTNSRLAQTPCNASFAKLDQPLTLGIATNQVGEFIDEENSNAVMLRLDPDGGSPNLVWIFPDSTYQPLISWLTNAGGFNVDGTNCATADQTETQINSGNIMWRAACADNDASTIYFNAMLPDKAADGTTFIVKMAALNVNATPAGDVDLDVAIQCRGNSDVVNSTYGTEIAIDFDQDAAGVCGGSACVQYELQVVTSAAVTGNGDCNPGDLVLGRIQVDATGTTEANITDWYIINIIVEFATDSLSD